MKKLCILVLTCLSLLPAIGGCGSLKDRGPDAGAASGGSKSGYGRIELLRDSWGVPHVFADTDAGAMYGLGYAAAQDRPFQMYYNLRIIQGRLAEVVGDVKVGVTRQQPRGPELRAAKRHRDADDRLLAGRPGDGRAARPRGPRAPGGLQPGRQRLPQQRSERPVRPVREVRPGARAVDAGGVHRLLVAAEPVLLRRRPAGD